MQNRANNTLGTSPQNHENNHVDHEHESGKHEVLFVAISFILLLIGIALDNCFNPKLFSANLRFWFYLIAYLPVGWPVIIQAIKAISKSEFFTEFSLMTIATIGAFAIGEYPEGVAVMLFYAVGELFQNAAVKKAKNNIKSLLDVRPKFANVVRDAIIVTDSPENVKIGEIIQVKPGEKVPLDGNLLSDNSSFNTVALTGESKPMTIRKNQAVLSGMLNIENLVEIEVTKKFADSSLSRILELVQNASNRKANTELFIRRFAKIYTPIVFFLALAFVVFPYFIMSEYSAKDWLYRAFVFLVIACPCALVISIPLGYFGGIGAASRNGILVKGGNYLDILAKINVLVMDKTGTLTEGVFKVQSVFTKDISEEEFLKYLCAIESKSTHPIARAIVEYGHQYVGKYDAINVQEIAGHGLVGACNGKKIHGGNAKLLEKFKINYDKELNNIVETIVFVAIDGVFVGYITISDKIKSEAEVSIQSLRKIGITQTIMLSGDKDTITQKIAKALKIDKAYGGLLPEGKVKKLEELKQNPTNIIAFVGDGINDAPVLALSDVGIAMGAMGSDVAIETADVVIQTDQISRIAMAIKIGRKTQAIVWQNVILAFGVKIIVLVLGGFGLATMWEAVFADVGVALLAILNAMRVQSMEFG